MEITEYAFSLCALLATFLVPVAVLHQILRTRRRALQTLIRHVPAGTRR